MKFYRELTLLPNAEVGLYFLWKKVFQEIHLALVNIKDTDNLVPVGLSFPEYSEDKTHLGKKIRFFSETEESLKNLNLENSLKNLSDYVHLTSIRPVLANIVKGYAQFRRWRGHTNVDRLIRRRAKRRNESMEDSAVHYSEFVEDRVDLPYIQLKSLSGNRNFRLVIDMKKSDTFSDGRFTCYGMAEGNSTVPWF